MSSQNITHIIKNGGFPPIKYCLISSNSSKDKYDKNEFRVSNQNISEVNILIRY